MFRDEVAAGIQGGRRALVSRGNHSGGEAGEGLGSVRRRAAGGERSAGGVRTAEAAGTGRRSGQGQAKAGSSKAPPTAGQTQAPSWTPLPQPPSARRPPCVPTPLLPAPLPLSDDSSGFHRPHLGWLCTALRGSAKSSRGCKVSSPLNPRSHPNLHVAQLPRCPLPPPTTSTPQHLLPHPVELTSSETPGLALWLPASARHSPALA